MPNLDGIHHWVEVFSSGTWSFENQIINNLPNFEIEIDFRNFDANQIPNYYVTIRSRDLPVEKTVIWNEPAFRAEESRWYTPSVRDWVLSVSLDDDKLNHFTSFKQACIMAKKLSKAICCKVVVIMVDNLNYEAGYKLSTSYVTKNVWLFAVEDETEYLSGYANEAIEEDNRLKL